MAGLTRPGARDAGTGAGQTTHEEPAMPKQQRPDRKGRALQIRVTPDQKAAIAAAAEADGRTVSGWVRRVLLRAAKIIRPEE